MVGMNKTFKQFFYKTLIESPRNTGDFVSEYSDTPTAMIKYDDIMKDKSIKVVHTLYPDSHSVYLYEERDENDITLYFVPKNDNFIYGYATYEVTNDGGAIMTSVYNRPMYFGLAQGVYNKYIIPTYNYIMSDGNHSPDGKKFWKKIINSNLDKRVEIWDFEMNKSLMIIDDPNQIDKFYGDTFPYEKYRIKISK